MTDIKTIEIDSDSEFTGDRPEIGGLGYAAFASDHFSSVELFYSSPGGIMELYTAIRYGKRFILKAIKAEHRNDPVCNVVLRKEFEIGITLDHPNIRRIFSIESLPQLGWVIVMEYIDGETLDSAISGGRVNPLNARTVASQLAGAVEYLHKRQIVHRDIKPTNIMVTYSGTMVKLIDFSLSDSESYVIIKNPAGTRKYLAPEQLKPDAKPSVKSDIYSLGLILGELSVPGSDRELNAVSRKCTASDPDKRPGSIADIRLPRQSDYREPSQLFSLDSPRLTSLLLVIAAVMAAVIFILMFMHTK